MDDAINIVRTLGRVFFLCRGSHFRTAAFDDRIATCWISSIRSLNFCVFDWT